MKPTMPRWIAVVMVLIGASSYGMLSPFIKMAYDRGWSGIQVSASQMTMGTAVVWALVLANPKAWSNPFREPWIRLSLVGIFGLAMTTLCYNTALSKLDASFSIVLLFQFTWITIVMDSIFSRRWPSKLQIAAVGIVLAGTLLAVNVSSSSLSDISGAGIAFGLISACTYSLFLFFAGKIKTNLHATMKSAVMLTAALPVIYLMYPPQSVFESAPGALLLWGILLGTLGQAIPTVMFNTGIPRIGSSLAAMLASMELPVAVTAAFLILRESVALVQWAGIGLILIGIVVSEIRIPAKSHSG